MTEKQKQLGLLAVIVGVLLIAVASGTIGFDVAAIIVAWALIIGAVAEWASRRKRRASSSAPR